MRQTPVVIEYLACLRQGRVMLKRPLTWPVGAVLALAVMASAGPAAAACYADYKAKQDNPLKLHYGVIEIPDRACNPGDAARVIARRIGKDGWTLLNVLGVFGPEGLAERQASAGQFFLRY